MNWGGKMKILIVEDDSTIRSGLKYCLECEGFETLEAGTAKEAKEQLKEDISCILMDVNLPDENGFDLFKEIHKENDIPVIFLTANDLETSIVMGLDMGAEDYVTKPFKTRELISRMKNVLRRNKSYQSPIIKLSNITIDTQSAKVKKEGKDVFLTTMEYKILLILATNPNTIFTREKILADIWDVNEDFVNDNTLTVYIKRIREKIEDDANNPKIIKTIRGMGYKVEI